MTKPKKTNPPKSAPKHTNGEEKVVAYYLVAELGEDGGHDVISGKIANHPKSRTFLRKHMTKKDKGKKFLILGVAEELEVELKREVIETLRLV